MVPKRHLIKSRDKQGSHVEGSMLVAWIGCVSSNGTEILVPVKIKPKKVKGGQNRNPKPFYVIKSISKALNNQIW